MSSYFKFIKGSEIFKKLKLKRQIGLIEHVFKSLSGEYVESAREFVDFLTEAEREYSSEIYHFITGLGLAFKNEGREKVRDELKRLGFKDSAARKLVDKLEEVLPSLRIDAQVLKELSFQRLSNLANCWVKYMIGEFKDFGELAQKAEVPKEIAFATHRFFSYVLEEVLLGRLSIQRFKRELVEKYGFTQLKASVIVDTIQINLERLRNIILFRYLEKIRDELR